MLDTIAIILASCVILVVAFVILCDTIYNIKELNRRKK